MSSRRVPLVLHSSLVRLSLQVSTPVLLLGFGLWGLARGGGPVAVVVTLLGAAVALVVLLDLPLRSEFDEDGVTRVCLLRRHRLPWSRVVSVERLGGAPSRRGDDGERKPPSATRGLAARTGPRRLHLLVDRRESHAEYVALSELLDGRGTRLRAGAPPLEAPPAGRGPRALHRRRTTD